MCALIRFFFRVDPDDLDLEKYVELSDEIIFLAEIGAIKFNKDLSFNG